MKRWWLLKTVLLECELCYSVLCTFTVILLFPILLCSALIPWKDEIEGYNQMSHSCTLKWGQAGLLREPRETDTHHSGIWDQLCCLLPLSQKPDSKGQAGKVDGIAWYSPLHRHTASKAERKGSFTFLLPSPEASNQGVGCWFGKLGSLKIYTKNEMAWFTFWKVPSTADTDWCASRALLNRMQ